MMKDCLKYLGLFLALTACSVQEPWVNPSEDHPELTIEAYVEGAEYGTKAVAKLADYVGRSKFVGGDKAVFTNIRRTSWPIEEFTYPGEDDYEGVTFIAGAQGGWTRGEDDGAPERVYWTDAVNPHTFVAYSIPQDASFDWHSYKNGEFTYYVGSLGVPSQSGEIAYTDNDVLQGEDLLICYDKTVKAQPGGSVALVKFGHALSSVRVVVNINGFSSSSSAVDNETVVSDMRLLHQPTHYMWEESSGVAQPFRDQTVGAHLAYGEQRKDLLLWIPNPDGVGSNQARTFTFYGITTPQPMNYLTTLDAAYRKTELSFNVTYPDPLNPAVKKTHNYTAVLKDVCFESGYNTTINITLNHKDEQMVVGAEFEDWQFVETPDQGELKKNSTFLHDTNRSSVTILGDDNATIDDATWLYKMNGVVYDIYGHTGTQEHPFQISTAYQLLSFAYEVANGNDFEGQYVSLDADITLQPGSDSSVNKLAWIGIGDASHPFNGTFLGGQRFIYRLVGSPLFGKLGTQAKVESLQVQSVSTTGSGLFTNTNQGLICACRVVGDASLGGSVAGSFVGSNAGVIFASYHIGTTSGSASVGGIAGTNSGTIVACYNAGKVEGSTVGGVVAANSGTLLSCHYNSTLLPSSVQWDGVTGHATAEMTKEAFTDALNAGITSWCTEHSGYGNHSYVFQPANYPYLND